MSRLNVESLALERLEWGRLTVSPYLKSRARRIAEAGWPGSSTHEPIIFFVGPDPDPCDGIRSHFPQSAVMIADPNSDPLWVPLQVPEAERWMVRIAPPKLVIFDGQFLNFGWQ